MLQVRQFKSLLYYQFMYLKRNYFNIFYSLLWIFLVYRLSFRPQQILNETPRFGILLLVCLFRCRSISSNLSSINTSLTIQQFKIVGVSSLLFHFTILVFESLYIFFLILTIVIFDLFFSTRNINQIWSMAKIMFYYSICCIFQTIIYHSFLGSMKFLNWLSFLSFLMPILQIIGVVLKFDQYLIKIKWIFPQLYTYNYTKNNMTYEFSDDFLNELFNYYMIFLIVLSVLESIIYTIQGRKGKNQIKIEKQTVKFLNMSKKYSSNIALHSCNICLNPKELCAVIGHNGAGKSTMLDLISEIISSNISTLSNELNVQNGSILGYCTQKSFLIPHLTGLENIKLFCQLRNQNISNDKIQRYLDILHLDSHINKMPNQMSAGIHKKFMFVLSILSNPEFLLLDEHTAEMDLDTKFQMSKILKELYKGKYIIICAQELEEVEQYCDSLILLSHGEIISNQLVGEFKKKYGEGYKLRIDKSNQEQLALIDTNNVLLKCPSEITGKNLVYQLNSLTSESFLTLIQELDNNKIKYEILFTTLKDSFLSYIESDNSKSPKNKIKVKEIDSFSLPWIRAYYNHLSRSNSLVTWIVCVSIAQVFVAFSILKEYTFPTSKNIGNSINFGELISVMISKIVLFFIVILQIVHCEQISNSKTEIYKTGIRYFVNHSGLQQFLFLFNNFIVDFGFCIIKAYIHMAIFITRVIGFKIYSIITLFFHVSLYAAAETSFINFWVILSLKYRLAPKFTTTFGLVFLYVIPFFIIMFIPSFPMNFFQYLLPIENFRLYLDGKIPEFTDVLMKLTELLNLPENVTKTTSPLLQPEFIHLPKYIIFIIQFFAYSFLLIILDKLFITSYSKNLYSKPNSSILSIKDLEMNYKNTGLVLKINKFESNNAYVYGLIGQNGVGKTTFIDIINKKIKRTKGSLTINGHNFDDYWNTDTISYCPQELIFMPKLSLIENLKLMNYIKKSNSNSDKEFLNQSISSLYLTDYLNFRADHLSKGNLRKMCFCMSMIGMQTKLLSLDEPATGFDPNSCKSVSEIIKQRILLGDKKKILIYSTHNINEIEDSCDEVIILNEGTIQKEYNVKKLKEALLSEFLIHYEKVYGKDNSSIEKVVPFFRKGRDEILKQTPHYVVVRVKNSNMKLSEIFQIMNKSKNANLISSFYITHCSLNQLICEVIRSNST